MRTSIMPSVDRVLLSFWQTNYTATKSLTHLYTILKMHSFKYISSSTTTDISAMYQQVIWSDQIYEHWDLVKHSIIYTMTQGLTQHLHIQVQIICVQFLHNSTCLNGYLDMWSACLTWASGERRNQSQQEEKVHSQQTHIHTGSYPAILPVFTHRPLTPRGWVERERENTHTESGVKWHLIYSTSNVIISRFNLRFKSS